MSVSDGIFRLAFGMSLWLSLICCDVRSQTAVEILRTDNEHRQLTLTNAKCVCVDGSDNESRVIHGVQFERFVLYSMAQSISSYAHIDGIQYP